MISHFLHLSFVDLKVNQAVKLSFFPAKLRNLAVSLKAILKRSVSLFPKCSPCLHIEISLLSSKPHASCLVSRYINTHLCNVFLNPMPCSPIDTNLKYVQAYTNSSAHYVSFIFIDQQLYEGYILIFTELLSLATYEKCLLKPRIQSGMVLIYTLLRAGAVEPACLFENNGEKLV